MPKHTIYYGTIVHSKSLHDLEILPDAALGVTSDGTISFLDKQARSAEEAATTYTHLGFSTATLHTLTPLQFLFPGLVDTHMHAPQWPNLAIGMEGENLEWRENFTDPLEVKYSDVEMAREVYDEVVRKGLVNGSTTTAYNTTIHAEATEVLAECCMRYGQRALVGKVCMVVNATHGNWEESVERSLEGEGRVIGFIEGVDPQERLLSPCVEPRGGSFVTPELMRGLGETGRRGDRGVYRVQTHMAETTQDVERMKKLHPGFESYAEMYDHYGLLHRRCILAHCNHLTDRDVELVAQRGAGISHNPNSNTCLRAGECRVRHLLDAGIKVGLGTDCSAGYSPSILDAMRQASNVSRHLAIRFDDPSWTLSIEEVIFLGTLGGATVCDLQDKIGNFEEGKMFDALLIDTGLEEDNINVRGWENDHLALVKKWVFLGDDRSIRRVWVNGNLVSGKDMDKPIP